MEEEQHRRDAAMSLPFSHHLLSRGMDTELAANDGDLICQAELGYFHFSSAFVLDLQQGAPADDQVVTARWAETLRFTEMAAEQGPVGSGSGSQGRCGIIYANGGRSVPRNWATAVKWWRKAAGPPGDRGSQWFMGLCYYYGRGVDRDVAQAQVWFRMSAAQGHRTAAEAVLTGVPGQQAVREGIVHFTDAGSATQRRELARKMGFPGAVMGLFQSR